MYYLCTQKDVFRRRKIKRATQPVTPPPPKKHQYWLPLKLMGFPKGSAVKNLPTVQETQVWSLPGSGKSSGGGNGNPLQYYLKNPMDRGAWRATVQRVTKSWAQPSEHKTQRFCKSKPSLRMGAHDLQGPCTFPRSCNGHCFSHLCLKPLSADIWVC